MIDKAQLQAKLGNEGFKKFVDANKSNQPTGHDKTRGIRGRVRWRRCEHGVWVIDNYEPKHCDGCCSIQKATKSKDFKPYFNMGLGTYVESRSEEKRVAKQKGYEEAG